MGDIRQEDIGIYDVCTTLNEYEDMFASKGSKANEYNGQIISSDNQIEIVLQDQNEIINSAEKISEIAEKGPDDQAQSALNPVPENPSPAEASTEDTTGTDQIGAATTPAPVTEKTKRPPKRKRGRRVLEL